MLILPKLYAITDFELSNCSHEEIVQMMLEGGARLIQLRDKEASPREFLDATRNCLDLTRAAGALLIVNDRVDIALTSEADGVHLGQDDMSVEEARDILGDKKIIGLSTHSIAQFEAALDTSADYIAVGPVYPTTTKADPSPVVGLDLLRQARRITDRPIVAIGGINPERAKQVLAAGADCVAAISALYPWPEKLDLTSKPETTAAVRAFLRALVS
jgi:thiamine-phosphate diphosphorylase